MKRAFLLLFSFAILGLVSCESSAHEEKESIPTYKVTSPLLIDTVISRQYVCQIHSFQHIDIRALERGYLQDIYVDEGQFVKEGQLMFQIMPRLYQAELQKAQAETHFAEIEYQNTMRLAENNIVAPNELALAEAKLDKAKAELALAQVHLGFTKIRAPFDGIMDHFHARLGSLVDEGDLLTTLSDNHLMWVYFNVPEAEYLNFENTIKTDSLKVKLLLANNKIFEEEGLVTTIEADFNNETGNIAFRATFANPKGLLRHGETGSIIMKSPLNKAILIPQKATFEILENKYVFVLGKDNIVHSKQILIGAELEDLFQVTYGLEEGDRILLEGLRRVRDGDEIIQEYEPPMEVFSHLKVYAE